MDDQLPKGLYFNSPMIILFSFSGLTLFYFGCCIACCFMHYWRGNDAIEVLDDDPDLRSVDLGSKEIINKQNNGDEVIDFYGKKGTPNGTTSDVQLTKKQKKKINGANKGSDDEENPFDDRREDHRSTGKPKSKKGANVMDSGVWGFAKEVD